LENNTQLISPEDVRPYLKAGPRLEQKRGRKKGKARILTETPENNLIEKETEERQKKATKQNSKKKDFIKSS